MMMNEPLIAAFALTAGVLLGVMFYGGLWWTVRRGVSSGRAALWFLASLLLRMGTAVAGFYLVSAGQWQRLLLCLAGFIAARLAVIWLTRPAGETSLLNKSLKYDLSKSCHSERPPRGLSRQAGSRPSGRSEESAFASDEKQIPRPLASE